MKTRLFLCSFFTLLLLWAVTPAAAQPMNQQSLQQPTLGLSLGSSYTTGFNGGGLFSQTIAPHLQWSPARRWNLMVGTVISNSRFSGQGGMKPFGNSGAGFQNLPQNLLSTTIYASGAYQVNEKLVVRGTTWLERNNMPQVFEPQMNPMAFGNQAKGMMIGLDYRLTENLHFGAEVRMSSGFNPYHPSFMNPYRNQGFLPGSW